MNKEVINIQESIKVKLNKLESINEERNDIVSVLLGQCCVSHAKVSEYLKETDHALCACQDYNCF